MKKSKLFLLSMLVVVLGCGLVMTGCGDIFGSDNDDGGNNGSGDSSLSTNWSQGQWESWFNSHSATNADNVSAIATFVSGNSAWISSNSWWSSLYTNWASGSDSVGGGDSLSGATNWTQSQWQSWFNSHSPTNTSNQNAIAAFWSGNSGWISSNSWWSSLYTNWASGSGGDKDDEDDYDSNLSTSWSQSQWQSWFNSHSVTASNASAISTFMSSNSTWISSHSWWSSLYTTWVSGGGGHLDEDPPPDSLNGATGWTQSQWQSWFNSHSVTNTSDVTAISTFVSNNAVWASSTSWWYPMYTSWASGGYY
jgi:hypothetical protein